MKTAAASVAERLYGPLSRGVCLVLSICAAALLADAEEEVAQLGPAGRDLT